MTSWGCQLSLHTPQLPVSLCAITKEKSTIFRNRSRRKVAKPCLFMGPLVPWLGTPIVLRVRDATLWRDPPRLASQLCGLHRRSLVSGTETIFLQLQRDECGWVDRWSCGFEVSEGSFVWRVGGGDTGRRKGLTKPGPEGLIQRKVSHLASTIRGRGRQRLLCPTPCACPGASTVAGGRSRQR